MGHLSRWIGCFKKIYMRACLSLLLPWTLFSLDLPLLDDNQMLLQLLSEEVMLLHHERLVPQPPGWQRRNKQKLVFWADICQFEYFAQTYTLHLVSSCSIRAH
jgi:hypothetical protein